jgi:hypothetical protein
MQNSLDHTHLPTRNSSPSTDSVHAVAVTLTETKHAVEPAAPQPAAPTSPADDARREHIAVAAYFRAEHRGFESGHEMEDWIAAEHEVAAGEDGGTDHGPHPDP